MPTLILLIIIVMMIITAIIIILIHTITTAFFLFWNHGKAMRRAATVRNSMASDTRNRQGAHTACARGSARRTAKRGRPATLPFGCKAPPCNLPLRR